MDIKMQSVDRNLLLEFSGELDHHAVQPYAAVEPDGGCCKLARRRHNGHKLVYGTRKRQQLHHRHPGGISGVCKFS